MKIKDKILELRSLGMTYNQIATELNCSKGTISYHCGEGQKAKTRHRTNNCRKNAHPYARKLETFKTSKHRNKHRIYLKSHHDIKLLKVKIETFHRDRSMNNQYQTPTFTIEDLINKFGHNPKCYLTGKIIDISKPRTYAFDHIIPVSRGGTNDINNLGICTKEVNSAKNSMLNEEFLELCKNVLQHNGYEVK